jgi:DNA-directed RNA polymerase specialized sigma24 family protein
VNNVKLDAEYARTRAYELLSWLAGRSSRERAEMFGIPKATVKTRTYRAIAALVAVSRTVRT